MGNIDDELEDQQAVEELVTSIKGFVRKRCCIFLEGPAYTEVVHGRFVAFIREWPALVVRDLAPGRERLQRTRMVHIDRAGDICWCDDLQKCKQCPTYRELLDEAADEGDKDEGDAPEPDA